MCQRFLSQHSGSSRLFMKLRLNHSDNTHAHMCAQTCVYAYTRKCTLCMHMHTHTGTCPCFTQMCTHTHACIHAHTHSRTHTHSHTHAHTHTHNMFMHAHTHTHLHTHSLTHSLTHSHIHAHTYAHSHTCTTHTPTHMCMGVFCVAGFIQLWMYGEAKCNSLLKLFFNSFLLLLSNCLTLEKDVCRMK